MGRIYLQEHEVEGYIATQRTTLQTKGYSENQISGILALHYTKDMIIKYSKEEQDLMLDYWIKLILETDGGYWQVQELIQQPHSEFTHYTAKDCKSYERGNISKQMAKRELDSSAYKSYCKRLDSNAKRKVYKRIKGKVE